MARTWVVAPFAVTVGLFAAAVGCSSGDDGAGSQSRRTSTPPGAGSGSGSTTGVRREHRVHQPLLQRKEAYPQEAHVHQDIRQRAQQSRRPVAWDNVPDGVVTFALIMDSLEGVKDAERVHWVMWNLPADLRELTESVEHSGTLENGAVQGANDSGEIGYLGPCPPILVIGQEGDISAGVFKKQQIEQYTFRIYALDTALDLPTGATRTDLLSAMDGHILAGGVLVGERQGPTAFEKKNF